MSATRTFRSRASLNVLSFTLHRLRKRAAVLVAVTTDWALFIGIVLILGFGSSWYMIERGSPLTTVTVGPWVSWSASGRADSDPYTRAHNARLGILPLSTEVSQTFVAHTDSEGRTLHSSCDYAIEGREMQDFWWSLTAFDTEGRLIPNVLGRSAFTSNTMAIHPDGSYVAALSRDARPGNWLPTGGAGRLALAFTVLDLGSRAVAQEDDVERVLPKITRTRC